MASATTTASTLDPALFPGLICYYPAYRLLYCCSCRAVILIGTLSHHLYDCHHVRGPQHRLLVEHCRSLDLVTQRADLQLPPNGSPALAFVPTRAGYSCCQSPCRYLTWSRKQMRLHANRTYKLGMQACTDSYRPVRLQS